MAGDENIGESSICRICLQHSKNGVALFSSNEVSQLILNKIFSCFQITLARDTFLPNHICSTCSEELDSAEKFRLKCVTFEERFEKLYKSSCNVLEIEKSNSGNIFLENSHSEEEGEHMQIQNNPNFQVLSRKSTSKRFKCDICEKYLKSEVSLAKHKISMHEKRKSIGKTTGSGANRRYHCTQCSYCTPYGQTLVNHMRRHDGERPHRCQCGKSFTQLSSLAAHQKIHSGSMMFTCTVCGKQFKHSFSLKTHLRVHDTGKFSCNICFKILKSPQALQDHTNRHFNIRNYNCEDCGSTFITSSELKSHKTKHKPPQVECNFCGYKTCAKKNLIHHIKRHTGEKSFKCEVCNKSEYTRSELRRHQRVHSHVKPFPCPACSQRFAHSSSLNHHARKLHGLNYRWGEAKAVKVKEERCEKLLETT